MYRRNILEIFSSEPIFAVGAGIGKIVWNKLNKELPFGGFSKNYGLAMDNLCMKGIA